MGEGKHLFLSFTHSSEFFQIRVSGGRLCSNYVKIKKILFYLHLAKLANNNFVLGLKFRLLLKHSGYVIGHEMRDKQG